MKVHLLFEDDKPIEASCDRRALQAKANAMNGEGCDGPYFVTDLDLYCDYSCEALAEKETELAAYAERCGRGASREAHLESELVKLREMHRIAWQNEAALMGEWKWLQGKLRKIDSRCKKCPMPHKLPDHKYCRHCGTALRTAAEKPDIDISKIKPDYRFAESEEKFVEQELNAEKPCLKR